MGSKLVGMDDEGEEVSLLDDMLAKAQIPVDIGTMSKKEIDLVKFENARRAHTARIISEWRSKSNQTFSLNNPIKIEDIVSKVEAEEEELGGSSQTPNVVSSRLNEIRQHLFDNRQELALDTMHFSMAEHVLFAHISRF